MGKVILLNRVRMGVFLLLLSLLVVACDGQSPATSEALPTPLPVGYGASLSEWAAAVDPGLDQAEANNNAVNPAEPAATVPSPVVEVVPDSAPPSGAADGQTTEEGDPQAQINPESTDNSSDYRELTWEELVPAEYAAEAIMARYQEELAKFDDGDPAAMEVFTQMQNEFNNAPSNDTLNNTMMKLPGFIAPLEYTEELITEFLLVPYFGACIHVPAPPANQTVFVKLAEGGGIKMEDSFEPVWVLGLLTTEGATTELATAGYYVQGAVIEPYSFTR